MTKNVKEKRSVPVWAWIGALVVVAALAVGGTLSVVRDKDSDENSKSTSKPSNDLPVAEACYGGEDAHAAIKTAQTELPATDNGAATFVAAFSRWLLEYPIDPEMEAIAEDLFKNGANHGEFTDLPNWQEVDPELITRRADTSTSKYAIYQSGQGVSNRWIVQIKQSVTSKYNDAPDSTVDITDAYAVEFDNTGKWKFLRSYSQEEQETDLPAATDGGEPLELTPYSSSCRGDLK